MAQLWEHGAVLGSAVEYAALSVCGEERKWLSSESSGGKAHAVETTFAAQLFPGPEKSEH